MTLYDPLLVRQGETLRRTWPLPAGTESWRAECQIREYPAGPVIAELDGYVAVDDTAIVMDVPAPVTATISGSGVYDVLLVARDDSDETVRAVEGPVTVSLQVTVDDGPNPTGIPWLVYPGQALQPGATTYPRGV